MTSLEDLQSSMVDWHGLDPSKFGPLRLQGRFSITRDPSSSTWQDNIDCFLFDRVLVLSVEKEARKRALKGSVMLKHIKDVESLGEPAEGLEMHIAVAEMPLLKLRCDDKSQLDAWRGELGSIIDGAK